MADMLMRQIEHEENESEKIKRTNKALQNEKEFIGKRLKIVLFSNKEAKRAATDFQGTLYSIGITAFAAVCIAIVPIIFVLIYYYVIAQDITKCDLLGRYISNTTKLTNQYAQTYNGLLLFALIHE